MTITNTMVEYAYFIAKKVHMDNLTRSEGREEISKETGMGMIIGSANDYITVFLEMMAGKEYHRTINNYATRYYFENIRNDFGNEALNEAVYATDRHTKYYGTLGKGYLTGIEQIVKEFR